MHEGSVDSSAHVRSVNTKKDVDTLIRESEEALRRLDRLERREVRSASWTHRVRAHMSRYSHHFGSMGLAMGLFGLSIVRYREKYYHQVSVSLLDG